MEGLGIKESEAVNKAMQMKLLWKIIKKPDNVWVRLIKEKYLHETNVMEYTKRGNCSWQWSKLMNLRSTFSKGLRWQVGDGENIKFWKDNWLYDKFLFDLGVYNHDSQSVDINTKVADFISSQGKWKWNTLKEILPPNIIKDIECLPIPLNKIEDKLF